FEDEEVNFDLTNSLKELNREPITASKHLIDGDIFINSGESELSRIVALIYNDILEIASSKLSEEEHCNMFIYPIACLFCRNDKEYKLKLNQTNVGSKTKPDLFCTVNDILILNFEFKLLGCTLLQKKMN
ncbi:12993_t:CDS:2, partial [Racocetra persica]